MTDLIFGIDPGGTGAIARIDSSGRLLSVIDMPYADGAVLAPVLASIILDGDGSRTAWVERAQAMPKQGVASVFRYGCGYGVILGVLGALEVPYQTVRPAEWKSAIGLTGDKNASRRRATELFPTHADAFARAKDDGRAEACLIARYGFDRSGVPTPMPWG
jgi:crossover junction endodeoxyribonuclease RuvC